jgi:hypothetical protein
MEVLAIAIFSKWIRLQAATRGEMSGNETWNVYLEDKFLLANYSSPIPDGKKLSLNTWDVSDEFPGISLWQWKRDATVCGLGGGEKMVDR